MEKFKFALFSAVVVGVLGLLGYWAVTSIQSGSEFKSTEQLKSLQAENADLKAQVADLTDQLAAAQAAAIPPSAPDPTPAPAPAQTAGSGSSSSSGSTTKTYKYQSLINSLAALSKKGVTLKAKDGNASVGYVQQFLNLYFKTSNKIDNDYGATTQKQVASFQKDQGLKSDGQAGPSTFDKMVAWLKKQG